jgi:hypothetical protein
VALLGAAVGAASFSVRRAALLGAHFSERDSPTLCRILVWPFVDVVKADRRLK